MAKQQSVASKAWQSADNALKCQRAYDEWNAAFLCRYYAARRDEIMKSGDPHRIRLYEEHVARYAQRG